jgi:ubiquitin-like modifier-activating enzyme 5
MFYRPEQSGWNKTMACRHYCSELNPDTVFEVHNINIATEENKQKLKETVASGSLDRKSSVNMIIGCVDNWEARQVLEAVSDELQLIPTPSPTLSLSPSPTLSLSPSPTLSLPPTLIQVSDELQLPFMDAVVGDDAMSGHVQLIIPGRTGGLEAAPIKAQKEKRQGECAASLATTDSIIAGICAQNTLKYLLSFGEVAFLLSYNAITNDFTTRMTYPDPRKLAPGAMQGAE